MNTYKIVEEDGWLFAKRTSDSKALGKVEGTGTAERAALKFELNKYGWSEA